MKGSTLIIMKAKKEASSWFGGMAVPSWIEGKW